MNVVGTTLTILYEKVFLEQTICHNLMLYASMTGETSPSPLTTTFSHYTQLHKLESWHRSCVHIPYLAFLIYKFGIIFFGEL